MSRRASNAGGGVSLFPFLSILACLIGILTLMISVTVMVKSQESAGRDPEELARATEHQSLLARQRSVQQEIAKLTISLNQPDSPIRQLRQLEDRRIVLRRELDSASAKLKAPAQDDAALQKLVENLLATVEALRKQRPKLEQKLAALRAELARRTQKPDGKPLPIVVMPRGSANANVSLVCFVECDATGLILHRRAGAKSNIALAAIGTDAAYNQFLEDARRKPGSMVLYLIRDTGNAAYLSGAGWAESQFQLRTGKLPLPGKGEVNLSQFFK